MASRFDSCLDLDRFNRFFTTEALQKSPEVFQKVHTPIDRIEVDFYREANHGKFATEEELVSWILRSKGSEWHNRIFTLVGETGSGKSELAQAIFYAAKASPHHVPILISRSLTRIRDIVRLLREHTGQVEEEEIGEITHLSPETVVASALLGCLSVVDRKLAKQYGEERAQELRLLVQQEAFAGLITKAFTQYKQDVDRQGAERTLDLLNSRWYERLVKDALPWLKIAESYELFRTAINEEMKRQIQLGDLGGRLRAIAERYKVLGRRPVLILEDLTSFGFVKEDLLDTLFDVSQGNFDVVIGWTTGFEAEHFRTGQNDQALSYMVERMKGRFLTTSKERASYFLEQHHQEVIERYIAAVRRPECANSVPTPFFPLNAAAITRIYEHLWDSGRSKRTPRLLIDVVGQAIRKEAPPWRTLEELPNLQSTALPDHLFRFLADHEDAVLLLKWYADPKTGKVSRQLIQRFGISWPGVLNDYLTDASERTMVSSRAGSTVTTSSTQQQGAQEEPHHEEPAPQTGTKSTTLRQPDPTPTQSGTQDPLDQYRTELQGWLRGLEYPSRERLKEGVRQLVDFLSDHEKTFGAALLYAKEKTPVYMASTKDGKMEHPAVRLEPDPNLYAFYVAAIAITNKTEAAKAIQTEPRLAFWVLQLAKRYQQEQRDYLLEHLGIEPALFVLHAWCLVKGLSDGYELAEGHPFAAPALRSTPLYERVERLRIKREIRELMAYRQTIRRLFVDQFFGQGETLNLLRLDQVAATYDFGSLVQRLNRVKSIDVGFRVPCDPEERQKAPVITLSELVARVGRAGSDLQAFAAAEGATGLQTALTLADWAGGLNPKAWQEESKRVLELAVTYKVNLQADWQVLQQPLPPDWSGNVEPVIALASLGQPKGWGALLAAYRHLTALDGWGAQGATVEPNPIYRRLQALHALIERLTEVMSEVSARRAPAPVHSRSLEQNRHACQEAHSALLQLLEG